MFFEPRHVKEGKHYRHALKRLIHYKEDILKDKDLATLRELLVEIQDAIKSRSREKIGKAKEHIEEQVGKIVPPLPDAGWRENVEVFLVAIVIAAGVRAYFLQPFKIPTGSMQPTLYGIVGTPTDTPPPNIVSRAVQMVWLGRHYIDLVAKEDDVIEGLDEKTYANFFTFTTITCRKSSYRLFAPSDTLKNYFGLMKGVAVHKGESIARGYIDTGDQVFVDKLSYNFMAPHRGDVFVFKTTGITMIERGLPPGVESQHYIKRLAGVPGDLLSIDRPKLIIDGKIANQTVFQRVMSMENGYDGYFNGPLLPNPAETFKVPAKGYFAMGDNSGHSFDSRYWGIVPEDNVAGRGLFVYWPFSKRWGLIR